MARGTVRVAFLASAIFSAFAAPAQNGNKKDPFAILDPQNWVRFEVLTMPETLQHAHICVGQS
jgi:hypothetical protein